MMPDVRVTIAPPDAPEALEILDAYWRDILARYYGRVAGEADVWLAVRDFPSDDLAPPTGLFLLACDEHGVVGCAGLRWMDDGVAELTRVFVAARGRRRGWARALLDAAEHEARADGRSEITAEVRGDLVEAQALYESHGYERVAPFSNSWHADVWLRKRLD
jgi:ribosomal protein S18 acetylase RimI-like enzyme